MKELILGFVFVLFVLNISHSIVGRWETIQPDGNKLGMVFKPNDHFEGYINKKPFVSGTYTFSDDIIIMNGNGCINMPGKYRIHFYGNADSIRWEEISDECAARKKGLNDIVFERKK